MLEERLSFPPKIAVVLEGELSEFFGPHGWSYVPDLEVEREGAVEEAYQKVLLIDSYVSSLARSLVPLNKAFAAEDGEGPIEYIEMLAKKILPSEVDSSHVAEICWGSLGYPLWDVEIPLREVSKILSGEYVKGFLTNEGRSGFMHEEFVYDQLRENLSSVSREVGDFLADLHMERNGAVRDGDYWVAGV